MKESQSDQLINEATEVFLEQYLEHLKKTQWKDTNEKSVTLEQLQQGEHKPLLHYAIRHATSEILDDIMKIMSSYLTTDPLVLLEVLSYLPNSFEKLSEENKTQIIRNQTRVCEEIFQPGERLETLLSQKYKEWPIPALREEHGIGFTPLYFAVQLHTADILKMIIPQSFTQRVKLEFNMGHLQLALSSGTAEIIQLLFQQTYFKDSLSTKQNQQLIVDHAMCCSNINVLQIVCRELEYNDNILKFMCDTRFHFEHTRQGLIHPLHIRLTTNIATCIDHLIRKVFFPQLIEKEKLTSNQWDCCVLQEETFSDCFQNSELWDDLEKLRLVININTNKETGKDCDKKSTSRFPSIFACGVFDNPLVKEMKQRLKDLQREKQAKQKEEQALNKQAARITSEIKQQQKETERLIENGL